ncbi:MAG: hypothetical protein C4518_07015 [Desulfobacteraceae bacterium]|nr:MAG: hypothetical protein C4518_07015 [Desulfobacteraceae bacterium]
MFSTKSIVSILAISVALVIGLGLTGSGMALAQCDNDNEFTRDFRLQDCKCFKPFGVNPYFLLIPGYQMILEGETEDDGEIIEVKAVISVLREIKKIYIPGFGNVITRVVEEREWEDGKLIEVSRNFFAICPKTNSVFYFGEKVDDYEDGEIVGHGGSWEAGVDGAMPGIMMPGTFLLGSKYFQEYAPGVAVDRGENVGMGLEVETPAGTFTDCVKVIDTNPLDGVCEAEDGDEKIYSPRVGLVKDEELELVNYGFNIYDRNGEEADEEE